MHRTRTAAAVTLALAAIGLLPAAASATTVTANVHDVAVTAAAGEVNKLWIRGGWVYSPDLSDAQYRLFITEMGTAPLTAGAGCRQRSLQGVSCSSASIVTAQLGDGNDSLTTSIERRRVTDSYPRVHAYLGTGNDSFESEKPSHDEVEGGTGADAIRTGDEADVVFGGYGDDLIDGGYGDDVLHGEDGHDMIGRIVERTRCASGTLSCVTTHTFENGHGDGRDIVSAGAGNDRISLFDNMVDNAAHCGSGTDTLERDAADPTPTACETVANRS